MSQTPIHGPSSVGSHRRLIAIIIAGLIVCGVALVIRLNAPSTLPPEWVQLEEKLEEFRRAGFHPRVALPEPFDPITEFPVKSADEAGEELDDAELVLGVTVNGQSRAYPINMLTGPRREIINDRLAGQAIAATW